MSQEMVRASVTALEFTDEQHEVRAVPGWPGYSVSRDGRVYSMRRHRLGLRERVARPNHGGYLQIALFRESESRRLTVGHIVALAFLPPRPSAAHEIRHLDGNRQNNRADNLAWGTRQENIDDRERHGTTARGSRTGTAVLTENAVREIKQRLRVGETKADLARSFGVSWPCIDHIARGDCWKHITEE